MEPLRVLIIATSEDRAGVLTDELRRWDLDPDATVVADDGTLKDSIAAQPWDLVIVSDHEIRRRLTAVVEEIDRTGAIAPIIIVCAPEALDDAIEAMRIGARDFVFHSALDRLGPAAKRELGESRIREQRRQTELALAASEERYRAVVDDQTEFVIRWRPDGTRTFVNRAYCEYFGGTSEEFIGQSFMEHMPEEDQGFVDGFLGALNPQNPVATAEPVIKRPNGETAYLEWVNRGIFDSDGSLVEIQSVGRDVTVRRTADEAERQKMLLVEVLRDTAAALNSTLDLDEVFDRILANIGWVIPHNASAVFFAQGTAARVVRQRGWSEQGIHDIPDTIPLTETEVEALSMMMASGKPIVIQDTSDDPRWSPGTRRLHWVRSFAAAPLFDESKLSGVVALFCDRPDYFTDIHVELLEGFASQAASASRNARLFETVSKSQRELRRLSTEIVNAQEDERRRISKELHDGVAQTLTGVIINAELLLTLVGADADGPLASRVHKVASLAKQSLQQIRSLSHRLRPAMLDELGLAPTLRWFCKRFSTWSRVEVDLRCQDIEDRRLDPAIETALYRVIQEAVANAFSHAEGSRIEIEATRRPGWVTLRISGEGRDFGPTSEDVTTGHIPELGLLGIKERVASVGGELTISPSQDNGVGIEIRIPDPLPAG